MFVWIMHADTRKALRKIINKDFNVELKILINVRKLKILINLLYFLTICDTIFSLLSNNEGKEV